MFDTVVRVAITTRRRRRREREEYEEAFVFLFLALSRPPLDVMKINNYFSLFSSRSAKKSPPRTRAGKKIIKTLNSTKLSRGSIFAGRQKIWSARNNDTHPTNQPPAPLNT